MNQITPVETKHHTKGKVFVNKALKDCTHVFVRDDIVKKYDGPYSVIARTDKNMNVLINPKPQRISIDRIKAAHVSCRF